jgi:hypothetical protein
MIPETIEDLEKIEWSGYVEITKGSKILLGYYNGEVHMYYPNEMYTISSVPGKYLTLGHDIILELNNYWEKDLLFFESVQYFVKYTNRNKIINNIIYD